MLYSTYWQNWILHVCVLDLVPFYIVPLLVFRIVRHEGNAKAQYNLGRYYLNCKDFVFWVLLHQQNRSQNAIPNSEDWELISSGVRLVSIDTDEVNRFNMCDIVSLFFDSPWIHCSVHFGSNASSKDTTHSSELPWRFTHRASSEILFSVATCGLALWIISIRVFVPMNTLGGTYVE